MSVFLGANNIISPLGFTTKQNVEAIEQGKVAVKIQRLTFSDAEWCCAKIDETVLKQAFKQIADAKKYTFLEQMCILSIQDVIEQSGINLNQSETLLIISTTKGNIDLLEGKYDNIPQERTYLSTFAQQIGDYFSCFNRPLVLSNACISGLLAIIVAKRFIDEGTYKNIIVCGGDIISEFTLSGFKSFNALSPQASKPFDKNRIGINLGEAASSILLSSEKISNIQITAGSSANDANHISGPSRTGEGLFKAISETLQADKITAVDFISAHGTATEYNDEMESFAFSRANLQQSPLNSLKGYYGHTLGAAGVLESVIAIESLKKNQLFKSMGFEELGTSCSLNVIQKNQEQTLKTCLKTASGFGGCNAAALFVKVD